MPVLSPSSLFLDKLSTLFSENNSDVFAMFSLPNSDEIHLISATNTILKEYKKKINTQIEGFYSVPFDFDKLKKVCIIPSETHLIVSIEELLIKKKKLDAQFDFAQIQNFKNKLFHSIGKIAEKLEKSYPSFDKKVAQCVNEFASAPKLRKVVLASTKSIPSIGIENLLLLFLDLKEKFPSAMINLHYTPEWGLWLGASPEILVELKNNIFKTVAIAGTKILKKNQSLDEVQWGIKEIEEQALVSRYIINCFKKIRVREFLEEGPTVIKMGNLAHLCTQYFVNSKKIDLSIVKNNMLNLLHPTSAVCGMPKSMAMNLIHKYENFERQLFAGLVGVNLATLNGKNEQHFYVNIRCVKIHSNYFQLFAGAGLTVASLPKNEKDEILAKMNLLENILRYTY